MANNSMTKLNKEILVLELVSFLKKWGLWKAVQIFTNNKCYAFDEEANIEIRDSFYPNECNVFSNPEGLLDMTFEGPLSLLLRHHEYEVCKEDLSEEAKKYIFKDSEEISIESPPLEEYEEQLTKDYIWLDNDEFDSYEDWIDITDFCEGHFDVFKEELRTSDMEPDNNEINNIDFESIEDYEDFLGKLFFIKEEKIRDFYDLDIQEDEFYNSNFFYDDEYIANHIINEFGSIFDKYGLMYDLGFSWSLTCYKI